jgi:hypothetical protein
MELVPEALRDTEVKLKLAIEHACWIAGAANSKRRNGR